MVRENLLFIIQVLLKRTEDIRRRYWQSLQNLKKILPVCDNVEIFDNTEKLTPVATYSHNKLILLKKCAWLQELDLESLFHDS